MHILSSLDQSILAYGWDSYRDRLARVGLFTLEENGWNFVDDLLRRDATSRLLGDIVLLVELILVVSLGLDESVATLGNFLLIRELVLLLSSIFVL